MLLLNLQFILLMFPSLQHVSIAVSEALVEAVLGPPKYSGVEAMERIRAPGTAAGLVWTAAGGSVQYIECACIGYGNVDR
jgi:ATP-dependent Lon protease